MAFNNYMPIPQYGQYNALAPYQQRLDMMQQQYGAMQPQQPMQQMQSPQPSFQAIKGRLVSGEDEARNTIIDMDGSIFFFPDFGANCIYTKQMNPETFAPIFRVYKIAEAQPAKEVATFDPSAFAKHDEVEQLKSTIASMQETIQNLMAQTQAVPTSAREAKAK